jgi:hypothetical protein
MVGVLVVPSGQSLISRAITYNSVNNPESLVRIQESFFLSATGSHSIWQVLGVSGNEGFIGQLLIESNDKAVLGAGNGNMGSVSVTRGQWNSFELDLNFQTQRQSAYVNGVLIGQGTFANPTTSLGLVGFGVNNLPGKDQAFVDNLSITSSAVPELSTLTLLGIDAACLIMITMRRLKKPNSVIATARR